MSRENDARTGRRLEYFTIGWNATEAVMAMGAGIVAGSIALVGFGVDSVIESLSGALLLWRLYSHENDESREQLALKLVGVSFLLLALYVGFDAAKSLIQREPPHASVVGLSGENPGMSWFPIPASAWPSAPCPPTSTCMSWPPNTSAMNALMMVKSNPTPKQMR